MFSKYYKGMVWESLPKGEEKENLIAATDEELEYQYDKSKVKALKLYRDYKNFKKTVKDEFVKTNNDNYSNLGKTLLNDYIEKTLMDLITKSYSLAKSEIDSTKGIISSVSESISSVLKTAGGMLSYILGGDPIAKSKFDSDVKTPIKELCKFLKEHDEIKSDDEITAIFNKFKDTQASLEGYVSYIFKQIPVNETFENMPGIQVFLRILLGLAGVERAGKVISNDGTGNGKARANYVLRIRIKNYSENYPFGGGLLALVVYNTVYNAYRLSPLFKEMERDRIKELEEINSEKIRKKKTGMDKIAEKDE